MMMMMMMMMIWLYLAAFSFAKTEYIHRHDKAASYMHWKVRHNFYINW